MIHSPLLFHPVDDLCSCMKDLIHSQLLVIGHEKAVRFVQDTSRIVYYCPLCSTPTYYFESGSKTSPTLQISAIRLPNSQLQLTMSPEEISFSQLKDLEYRGRFSLTIIHPGDTQ